MEGDGNTLVNLILVLKNISAADEGGAAAGVDGIRDFHTPLAGEHPFQIHVEPGDP